MKSIERFMKLIMKHPYLSAFAVCVLLNFYFAGGLEYVPHFLLWVKPPKYLGLGLLIISALYFLGNRKENQDGYNAFFLITSGFLVKLYYVLKTSIYVRQHDVDVFGGETGHCGYIEYILYNHKLPDFDVSTRWQFYHPPLHHILSAVWIFINEHIFRFGYDKSRESLQMLTLFYSICIIITAYKILKEFKLSGRELLMGLLIISFHPTFILFSGSINNDVLSVLFIMLALLAAIKWYQDKTVWNIVKVALCIGFGMMTKISVGILAIPVGLLFILCFIKDVRKDKKKNLMTYIKQFAVFACISFPLGLWFGIRNFIKWHIPLMYVQPMTESDWQSVGDMSFLQRITDFSARQWGTPYTCWKWAGGYNEYNPLISLLKTSVFGEFAYDINIYFAQTIMWCGVMLALFGVAAIVITLLKKDRVNRLPLICLAIMHLAFIISYYKMCYDYPFVCSMNFRYLTPTVVTGALCIGLAMKDLSEYKMAGKVWNYSVYVVGLVLAIFSAILYTILI